ncbi:MAG: hypothetical protein ABIF11_05565 [Nitrospirota bacterium]
MEFWVIASKLMAMVSGFSILFSFQPQQVLLTPPQIAIENEQLIVKSKLLNAFSEKLDEIFLSGTSVTLKFKISLKEKNGQLIEEKEIFHTVSYDLVKKEWTVICASTSPPKKTVDTVQMKRWFRELNAKLVLGEKILPKKLYLLEIEANLLPIEIMALKDKKYDLMSFWGYKVPEVTSRVVLKE